MTMRPSLSHCGRFFLLAALITIGPAIQAGEPGPRIFTEPELAPPPMGPAALAVDLEPRIYVEPEFGPRFYPGDENTRLGQANLLAGNYGLAEQYFRRAVEVTRQNGAAWIGLAAAYDRLGRFGLADRAYSHAVRLIGENHIVLNNRGYSYLLRGDVRRARSLLTRAWALAPGDPTIANNIAVLDAGQGYFLGLWP